MRALARAGVLVVQLVMALGLVIALYVEAARERRGLYPHELAGACWWFREWSPSWG